ncbi:MAG: CxxC-x17-CxxC domain-containing protein [Nanoarchaeota archaeon]|nr:DNA-directed RNA polymerase [Nanoarchaeota archaeon]
MRDIRKDNRKKSQSRGFDRNRDNFGGSFQSGLRQGSYSAPRDMHKATCAECNSSCEVPFKPIEGKPVYCKECYRKRKDKF